MIVNNSTITNIEYSQLPGFAGNSKPHFMDAINNGFDGLKADMRLSKDGEIILCHDSGYSFDSKGRITAFNPKDNVPINDLSINQISKLVFDIPNNDSCYGPITLDLFLSLCQKYNMIPYLTIRDDPHYIETAIRMGELLKKYELRDKAIINFFTGKDYLFDAVKRFCGNVCTCDTKYGNELVSQQLIDQSTSHGYNIICLSLNMINCISPEITAYAKSQGLDVWVWGVSSEEDAKKCLKLGICGFQMYSRFINNQIISNLLYSNG